MFLASKSVLFLILWTSCADQRLTGPPVRFANFSQLLRSTANVPSGRSAKLDDIIFRFYGMNTTTPASYRVGEVKRLLLDQNFDINRPTVFYAHGYIEVISDQSILTLVKAYEAHAGYNTIVLDWANLGFGNYINVALDVNSIGKQSGQAISHLLKQGLSLQGLHLVGHSLGAHVLSAAARTLAERGFKVPRLTGLDPAYPGFYPPLFGRSISSSDAEFVDIIHTDGGAFGAPSSTGHADFWPNGGRAKQPGCPALTLPLSDEDFCSHWRSWAFWAESLEGGTFLARRCDNYDAFMKGECSNEPVVNMGIAATQDLRGNFYLKTRTKSPYALGEQGAS